MKWIPLSILSVISVCQNKTSSVFLTMALLVVSTLFMLLANTEKRLLLNDPDVILSQLHALERKMEDMTAKYTDLSVKYNTLLTRSNGMLMCIQILITIHPNEKKTNKKKKNIFLLIY